MPKYLLTTENKQSHVYQIEADNPEAAEKAFCDHKYRELTLEQAGIESIVSLGYMEIIKDIVDAEV